MNLEGSEGRSQSLPPNHKIFKVKYLFPLNHKKVKIIQKSCYTTNIFLRSTTKFYTNHNLFEVNHNFYHPITRKIKPVSKVFTELYNIFKANQNFVH